MTKISYKIVILIFQLSVFNLYADSLFDHNPAFLNFGFGNFGPSHQSSLESNSYNELEIKYYSHFSTSYNVILDFGVIFNTESGYGSCDGPSPIDHYFDVTSRLYYLSFLLEDNFEYFGYSLGILISSREKGFCDSGSGFTLRPSLGIKIGKIEKLYLSVEMTNDLIYSTVYSEKPILFGISYLIDSILNSTQLGYFKSDTQEGYALNSTFSIFERFLVHGQAVYRPKDQIYSFRFGVGYKI